MRKIKVSAAYYDQFRKSIHCIAIGSCVEDTLLLTVEEALDAYLELGELLKAEMQSIGAEPN